MKDIVEEIDEAIGSSLDAEYDARSTLAGVQLPRTLNEVLSMVFEGGVGCYHLSQQAAGRLNASRALSDERFAAGDYDVRHLNLVEGSRDWWMAYTSDPHFDEQRTDAQREYGLEVQRHANASVVALGVHHEAFTSWYTHPARRIVDIREWLSTHQDVMWDHELDIAIGYMIEVSFESGSEAHSLAARYGCHIRLRRRHHLPSLTWSAWLYWYEQTRDPLA